MDHTGTMYGTHSVMDVNCYFHHMVYNTPASPHGLEPPPALFPRGPPSFPASDREGPCGPLRREERKKDGV